MAIITGDDTNNTIVGTADDDTIYGLGGDDTLSGGAGNDILVGGGGFNALSGGDGIDTVSYAESLSGVAVFLGAHGSGSGDGGVDDFGADIENAWGSNFSDVLWASDTGNSELRGLGGNDDLYGDIGNDILDGGDGNDSLVSSAGADILKGGAGIDTVDYYRGPNVDPPGVAVTIGGIGHGGEAEGDVIGADIENLTGTFNRDILTGSAGENRLNGEGGDDTLVGGAGDDVLIGWTGADHLDGGDGYDIADYSFSAQVRINLFAGTASRGDAQGDVLTDIEGVRGGLGNDLLIGGSRGNTLDGGGGDDILRGDGQHDILIGGSGSDRFVYDNVGDSPANANADEIRDFSHAQGDRIDLRLIDADTATVGDQAFSFIGAAEFSHHAGELRAVVAGGLTTVTADVDGNGTADLRIFLSGSLTLLAADFQL